MSRVFLRFIQRNPVAWCVEAAGHEVNRHNICAERANATVWTVAEWWHEAGMKVLQTLERVQQSFAAERAPGTRSTRTVATRPTRDVERGVRAYERAKKVIERI